MKSIVVMKVPTQFKGKEVELFEHWCNKVPELGKLYNKEDELLIVPFYDPNIVLGKDGDYANGNPMMSDNDHFLITGMFDSVLSNTESIFERRTRNEAYKPATEEFLKKMGDKNRELKFSSCESFPVAGLFIFSIASLYDRAIGYVEWSKEQEEASNVDDFGVVPDIHKVKVFEPTRRRTRYYVVPEKVLKDLDVFHKINDEDKQEALRWESAVNAIDWFKDNMSKIGTTDQQIEAFLDELVYGENDVLGDDLLDWYKSAKREIFK